MAARGRANFSTGILENEISKTAGQIRLIFFQNNTYANLM